MGWQLDVCRDEARAPSSIDLYITKSIAGLMHLSDIVCRLRACAGTQHGATCHGLVANPNEVPPAYRRCAQGCIKDAHDRRLS